MDCCTHKSIFAFTTCYPKIHLLTHRGMCSSQEWGLMRVGWPSHHYPYCFSCYILTVDSHERLTGSVCMQHEHTADHCVTWGVEEGLAFQEAPLTVLHLCPAPPMGGSGLGLTERVQDINFSRIAESLFPPPYLTQSPAPIRYLFMPQEDGPGGWACSLILFLSACWAVNTAQHQEQQVLSLPIINYPCCITPGPLTPKLKISFFCTILSSSLPRFPIFFCFL